MTVIGVLLLVIAALLLVAVVAGGSNDPAVLDMGLFDVSTSTMGVFLIGAATVLIFVSGLELLRSGLRRSIARRRELKKARAVLSKEERREQRRHGDGRHQADPGERPAAATTTRPQPATSETTAATDPQVTPDSEGRGSTA